MTSKRDRYANEVASWAVAGALNAPFVLLARKEGAMAIRGLTAAVDFAHFVLLGALSALWLLLPWRRVPRTLSGFVAWAVLTLLGGFALRDDLGNLEQSAPVAAWLLRTGIAAVLAAVYLLLRQAREHSDGLVLPWVSGGLAMFLTVSNHYLPGDYPGLHLFVGACTACATGGIFGYPALDIGSSRRLRIGLLLLPLVALPALLLPAGSVVWKRLLAVPSSVAAPYLAGVLAPRQARGGGWLERRYPEWFPGGRSAQAPTRALRLPPDSMVLLITIDALRADVLASGQHDALLPELARLRDSSASFSNARSPAPSTMAALCSLFSGMYYSSLYWTKEGNVVLPTSDRSERLPALLSRAGIHTALAVSIRDLATAKGVTRGFDEEVQTDKHYGRAVDLMQHLLEQIDRASGKPSFLFAHFIDAHAPYTRGGSKGNSFERYLAEVALVDRELGRLQAHLRERRLESKVTLIVSADHGEAFGEHEQYFHSKTVYDELLRVPLLVKIPGVGARKIQEPVTLLDLGPTILDLFQLPTPSQFMGQSLAPLLAGRRFEAKRPIAADTGRRVQALLFPDGFKASRDLMHATQEVYDLKRDPGELVDLTAVQGEQAERYAAALDAFFAAHTLKRPGWEPPWRKF